MEKPVEILEMTKKIETSLLNHDSYIKLDILDEDVIYSQFNKILFFNPYMFHVKHYHLIFYSDHVILEPQYTLDKETYQNLVISCNKRIKKLAKLVKSSNEVDTILKLHNELTGKLSYSETINGHEIIDPIFYKKGVCEGFSKLIKAVCDELKIKCIIVNGKFKNSKELHAWNQIKLDGKWYNLDFTSDLSDDLGESFDYCLISDAVISADHEFLTPSKGCVFNDHDYYIINDLVIDGLDSLNKKLKKIKNKKSTTFCFKDVSRSLSIKTVNSAIRNNIKGKYVLSISFNSGLYTYHVVFK